MKNIEFTFSHDETCERLQSMFLTEEFRNFSWVRQMIQIAVDHCGGALGYYDETHPFEHGHFTTWMGFICRRKYENPYIHDLYLLHELAHLSNFNWQPNKPFAVWFNDMFLSEFNAALISEVFVYFYMRSQQDIDLRSKTFPHRIWADRWLERGDSLWKLQHEITCDRRMRINGYGVQANPKPNTDAFCDYQISRYALQNYQWAEVWRKRYDIVETSMHEVSTGVKSFSEHYGTLAAFRDDSVFFLDEALNFDRIYRENNQRFGDLPGGERSLNVCEANL